MASQVKRKNRMMAASDIIRESPAELQRKREQKQEEWQNSRYSDILAEQKKNYEGREGFVCGKCGQAGHLDYACRNTIKLGAGSDCSVSSTSDFDEEEDGEGAEPGPLWIDDRKRKRGEAEGGEDGGESGSKKRRKKEGKKEKKKKKKKEEKKSREKKKKKKKKKEKKD